jgi:hypothetical protein
MVTVHEKDVPATIKCVSADTVVGLQWSKSSKQLAEIKHRRGPSTPRHKRCVAR